VEWKIPPSTRLPAAGDKAPLAADVFYMFPIGTVVSSANTMFTFPSLSFFDEKEIQAHKAWPTCSVE
jgi:hypothetical protein